jgi:hypothetical protein
MPAFSGLVDDVIVATIPTDGHDMLNVRVAGSRTDEQA